MTILTERVPGQPAPPETLVDIPALLKSYFNQPATPVEFGTSGHRGSSIKGSFNEAHILAISQAICEYRSAQGISGPLYIGFDTHALSKPAFESALRVLAANGVRIIINKGDEYTPTPVISRLIIKHNLGREKDLADGIVITPSHNGPQDGGFKYNPTHGGPADAEVTNVIQNKANELIKHHLAGVATIDFIAARAKVQELDFIDFYVGELEKVIDFAAIRSANLRLGADPLGGAGVHYWQPIARRYGLNIEVTNPSVDQTFRFMTLDSDSTIRMDCSSKDAMASLISLKDKYDIAFGNDPDFDRHGIVTPDGLMNPNHYLAVAIWYLLQHRPNWPKNLKIGKTAVSSSLIDRIVAGLGRELYEVPVGFKWFVPGLSRGWLAFGGEESAGASFLDQQGAVWTTDKDGFVLALLAAEIMAITKMTPSQIYQKLTAQYGSSYYGRKDGPITDEQKVALVSIRGEALVGQSMAGHKVSSVLTKAPGNQAALGGIKVILDDGSWFAIRPSGTEPKMKIYVESQNGQALWQQIMAEAPKLVFK
ncbi:alpha-D-glucose phosphate-specific phosphoglucomutase [candidate division WOR-1 bacterium RIFOXYB2_FULL_48_7]|uniref:Alpha-D-glucose phosphate-specific phosphoglucomutase n=1 Tax=candidate division WOR-1 bacterium RIFOXYB2_FULL_48_7 TaxID=1802583 RepID=A0A1F4TBJ3_UNCSA|nr:MAG: alpha-D-glucose phosphate-specific phosphoglucomutase [candidate division WOR-1 bacterium RIFOXYB2_FULL_48_7]